MKKVISMIVAIAMLVTMFSTIITPGTAFAAQDYDTEALSYVVQDSASECGSDVVTNNGGYSKAIPAGVLGWAKYGYENAINQMEDASTTYFAAASNGFTVSVDSVAGKKGEEITVPIKFVNIPDKGISTADMTITYDADKLEYVDADAGSIVKNATTNFAINKESDGKLKALFLDYTMDTQYIDEEGVFANITFKVLSSASTTSTVKITDSTYGDNELSGVTAAVTAGEVSLNDSVSVPTPESTSAPISSDGFTAYIGSSEGESGEEIVVPVNFAKIPTNGISAVDMTVKYDADKLEYVDGEAGSIVTNASTNFAINKESDGALKLLFLDYTMEDEYISEEGAFANLTFKVIASAEASTKVSIDNATFGDKDLTDLTATLAEGKIDLNGGGTVSTPEVTSSVPTPEVTSSVPTSKPTEEPTEFTVYIGSAAGEKGEEITVPVNFVKVPSNRVSTADMTVKYDADMLEYVDGEAGSIVKNASTNFAINKESDGTLKLLFLDYTMEDEYIGEDGVFANLTFEVKTSSAVSTNVSINNATFGDKDLTGLTAALAEGKIDLNGGGAIATPVVTSSVPTSKPTEEPTEFTVYIGSAAGEKGEEITVPVNFVKVPSNRVSTADMTVKYDADMLEYVDGEAGSIVKNASTNFAINKESDGTLKLLFLDYTMEDEYIGEDGVFANLTFEVKTSSAVSTNVSINNATFGDKDLTGLTAALAEGRIDLNGGGVIVTPVPEEPTPTKTFTANKFTVQVDSVAGEKGEQISVPVYFVKVPANGVSTADMTITYDSDKLEYISGDAGSIVTNSSTNYAINKESDGKLKALFLDYTMEDEYISEDGVFINLVFEVKTSSAVSTQVKISKATFGDRELGKLTADLKAGRVDLNGGGTISTPVVTDEPTPVVTKKPTPTKAPVDSNLKVEFFNTNTQAQSNSIYPKFKLTNTGGSTINLSDVKLRYYYTVDGDKDQKFWCDWSPIGSSNVKGEFKKMTATDGADYYLEVSFSSGAIEANTSIDVQCRFAKSDWTNYNQADDYSFNSSASNYTTWNKVTAYMSGSLVWGEEPNGGTPATPTPTKVTTPTKTPTVTVTPKPTDEKTPSPNDLTVTVETVQGGTGDTVTVPVTFDKVPEDGVSTADMAIAYDDSKLEFVSGEAGSIVTDPDTNFAINLEKDGLIKVLFLDYTMDEGYISEDGVFANLTFKIKSSAEVGTTEVTIDGKPTFGDSSLSSITAALIDGEVEIIDGSAMKLVIGDVTGKAGSEVVVPLSLEGVSDGVSTADMAIAYDTDILEYVSAEAGSIITNAETNFAINLEKDGLIKVLFLDYTMEDEYISEDGVFANLTFMIKSSADDGAVAEISKSGKATFGDKNLEGVSIVITSGSVKVGDVASTPAPTDEPTSTPTATTEPTSTPTAEPTSTPVTEGFSLVIDTVEANPGSSVVVPVKLSDVESVGGVSTTDMTIEYDSDKLEFISGEAGDIIINPSTNFAINLEKDGLIKVLFLDYTMEDEYISEDGVFANLNFNVKSGAEVGTKAELNVSGKATFGDSDLNGITANVVNGGVNIVKKADPNAFKVVVDTVDAAKGEEVIVPVSFVNVPESGISTSNMTITYDADKIEFVGAEPGSIVTNAETNFDINNETNGVLKVLFLDYTMETQSINEDGVFMNLTFKVIADEGLAEISKTESTFGDPDLLPVVEEFEVGGVNIVEAAEGFTVSGYINPDFMATSTTAPIVNAGFKVEIVEAEKSVETDSEGYFEIEGITAGTYTVKITKDNYLSREIAEVVVSDNLELSTADEPTLMWAGDMIIGDAQDGAINLEDIMEICKGFNTISTDDNYKEGSDLNKDGAINLEDVMIVAKHFNKISSDY